MKESLMLGTLNERHHPKFPWSGEQEGCQFGGIQGGQQGTQQCPVHLRHWRQLLQTQEDLALNYLDLTSQILHV